MGFKSKLGNFKDCTINSLIYNAYYNHDIDENLVYLESRDGLDFTGNIFRIVEELSTGKYGDLKIHVHAKPHVASKIEAYARNYNLKIDKVITKEAPATETLENAKYIFTDSGIRPKYVKREGQIFVNTWHGTPLKVMGRDNVAEQHLVGKVQYTLLCSDYLLFPNEYMCERMTDSFMIEKIFPGKVLMEGYPRNSVFFDESRKDELKLSLGFEDKEIFVYMPTFRGVITDRKSSQQRDEIEDYLIQLDKSLKENQLMLVKLHVLNEAQIDFTKFNHIMPFPTDYESYDVVNMADVLITDYSSVLFDFANSRRKIILFNYDEEDYCSYRGFYFPLSDLPFPKVQDIDGLVSELNSPKDYDDAAFIDRFCRYDRIDSVKYLCDHIFNSKGCCRELSIKNDKENVLIYAGSLLNNGITRSLTNLLSMIDLERYNFFLSFRQWDDNIVQNHEDIFKRLPDDIEYLPLRFDLAPTVREKIKYNDFFSSDKETEFPDELKELFERAFNRQYFPLDFKLLIDFDGYNKNESLMLSHNRFENAVWVHSDMIQEISTRSIQNRNVLKEVYSRSDKVCVVSNNLVEPTSEIGKRSDNIHVIHNLNNYSQILEDSDKEITFDKDTVYYSKAGDIGEVLSKPGKKFITIGRFSPEKGHERLIKAFNRFCTDYPDSQLIIIGGHGVLYDDTVELINSLEYGGNISLIKGISNPMPILKQCDLFIMPSYYEGWGIVIMEADTLDVPVIATDIKGTQWMLDYDGNLVDDSEEGILKGMHEFMKGNIHTLHIDYDEYNEEIISDFYSLIDD